MNMKKQLAILALAISGVTAPYIQAAGPTDNIPGLSQFQNDRQSARLQGVNLCCTRPHRGPEQAAFSNSHMPKSNR